MQLQPINKAYFSCQTQQWFETNGISEVWAFNIPLRVQFRGVKSRSGLIFRGACGLGEFAPFWEYQPKEASSWLLSALECATLPPPPPKRNSVPINTIIPVVPPEKAAKLALQNGAFTAKIKVADPRVTLEEDAERVGAVADSLRGEFGEAARVRVDANGAWGPEEALRAIDVLANAAGGLEYVEQPCQTVEELAFVRKNSDVLIAADESIRRADDPFLVAEAKAADLAIVKVAPLGGMRRALLVAEQLGMPVVVSSAVDTVVGLAAGVQLAAALPDLPFACGLGTGSLLTQDVAKPLLPKNGSLDVREATKSLQVRLETKESGGLFAFDWGPWVQRLEEVVSWLTHQ